jgi:hypothetical protein
MDSANELDDLLTNFLVKCSDKNEEISNKNWVSKRLGYLEK